MTLENNKPQSFEPPQSSLDSDKILTEPKPKYPLPDEAYDVVSLLYHKSKALQTYDKYIQDVQTDNVLRNLLLQIRTDEERHLEGLKNHLGRLLNKPATPPQPPLASTGSSPQNTSADTAGNASGGNASTGSTMPGD
jgi:hypothetical protein